MFFYKVHCPHKLPEHFLENDKVLFTIWYETMDGTHYSVQKSSYEQYMQITDKGSHMFRASCYLVEPSLEDRTYLKLLGVGMELVPTKYIEFLTKTYLSNSYDVRHIWNI